MSVEAMSQVWKLDLPRDQKLVLMAFADHANDSGHTYPSIARVAWKCGYNQPRSVSAIVKKLIDAGVLVVLEPAKGRHPTLYRIRWDQGQQLPEFDPHASDPDRRRGAKNAPQTETGETADSGGDKSLTDKGENDPCGAENAPQGDGVQKTHPKESVGVRFEDRRGAFSARRGAVATAPEPLTINQRRAGARASESRTPARDDPSTPPSRRWTEAQERKIFLLNNTARNLGIPTMTPSESIAALEQRVNEAHGRKLEADLERQRAAKQAASP